MLSLSMLLVGFVLGTIYCEKTACLVVKIETKIKDLIKKLRGQ